jgi:glycosyltransferase involved in cell wall biosynthesis
LGLGIELKNKMGVKLLLHLHELSTVIDEYVPDLKDKDNYIDHYIVPSSLNKKCLMDEFLISDKKIDVIESVSEIDCSSSNIRTSRNEFRVLMTGGAYWRKGDDLFILIAKKVYSINPNIKFYWIGHSSEERKRVNQYDIKKMDLTNTVFFESEQANLNYWYQNSDVFLLPSREDPFPLSAIEAGMSGMPILCFKDATGISPFLDDSCVFNYLDIDSVAFKILQFFDDSLLVTELGKKNKLVFQEFTAKNQISKICNVITSLN